MPDAETAAALSRELLPAAQAFGAAVGRSSLGQELSRWLSDIVRYRRLPHQARLLTKAADEIRASGLPASAVEDRLLRAVLEEGGFEDDEPMQGRWARLLANAAVGIAIPPAFPEVLRQLEPIEARLLDRIVAIREPLLHGQMTYFEHCGVLDGLRWRHLDNLERLQLLHWVWQGPVNVRLPAAPADCPPHTLELYETQLGRDLVAACASPGEQPQD